MSSSKEEMSVTMLANTMEPALRGEAAQGSLARCARSARPIVNPFYVRGLDDFGEKWNGCKRHNEHRY